ncbi:MAG: DUF4954 family protein [Lacibacter sp.]
MNHITKVPISNLGYNFIPAQYLPKGKDEYHLRNKQNRSGIAYRKLTAHEIEVLVRNQNTSDNWNNVLVSDAFAPELVKNCKFFGLVRIGKLEPFYLEFHAVKLQVGIYNSTIISCDLGDNVVIDNVHYLSHYIIGNEVIITNVEEMGTTNYAKFGNGIIKQGEEEKIRIWLEVCNENAGRKIIPFNGMLPGDAWLWSRHRDNAILQQQLKAFTEKKFDSQRGYYGKVGDRTVIKSCKIIKDVWIGSDAYLKGANKLKNLTINSSPNASSQVGEGCELVNGIMEEKCRVFYGVKAVRFYMASNSQLKYGARLINSYLGNNATISCCEVLNSLIFPAHEQHHNNSFLCAALVMGQSNVAAGATLGSNHNSRGADGEFIAGRGFWPALCVSIKHNSRFASYTLLAKGDYPAELHIPLPFALVSNDAANDRLLVMPAYWFRYNMYALARNAAKYPERDKRPTVVQPIEYDYLAPDSVNEMFTALRLLERFTGKAALLQQRPDAHFTEDDCVRHGAALLLADNPAVDELEILAEGFENSQRKVVLVKVRQAYQAYRQLIEAYAARETVQAWKNEKPASVSHWLQGLLKKSKRTEWVNMGGQLIPQAAYQKLISGICKGTITDWDGVHKFYEQQGAAYAQQKLLHALACWKELQPKGHPVTTDAAHNLLRNYIACSEWLLQGIRSSRSKDYSNPFRQMVYESVAEMEAVIGKLEENTFIRQQEAALQQIKKDVQRLLRQINK